MLISQVINMLEAQRAKHGDIVVAVGREKADGTHGEGPACTVSYSPASPRGLYPEHVLIEGELYGPIKGVF